MRTLLLDRSTWDLCVDAKGNIAVANDPYSVAQDVCSELRVFAGECWFDTARGIPYFERVLGKLPPLGYLKSLFIQGARRVPDVASVRVFFERLDNDRVLRGQIQLTHTTGVVTVVNFGPQSEGTGVVSPVLNIVIDPFGNFVRSLSLPGPDDSSLT